MAPITFTRREVAHLAAQGAAAVISKRGLKVQGAQGVTLGVIAAYVVGIAILWNVPYVQYVLWPFKVTSRALCINHAKTAANSRP